MPGETVLIIAAVYAGTGRLSIWLVALIGFIAAILGDNVGFAIGHFGGRPLAERYGKYIFLTPERLDKTAKFFDRHGGKVIVIARFVEGLRQANGLIAGITGMHWKKFFLFNMLGAALWVGVWVSIGYFSGSHIDSIYKAATKYELFFGIAVGVLILAWVAWRLRKHRRRREDRGGGSRGEEERARRRAEWRGTWSAAHLRIATNERRFGTVPHDMWSVVARADRAVARIRPRPPGRPLDLAILGAQVVIASSAPRGRARIGWIRPFRGAASCDRAVRRSIHRGHDAPDYRVQHVEPTGARPP